MSQIKDKHDTDMLCFDPCAQPTSHEVDLCKHTVNHVCNLSVTSDNIRGRAAAVKALNVFKHRGEGLNENQGRTEFTLLPASASHCINKSDPDVVFQIFSYKKAQN